MSKIFIIFLNGGIIPSRVCKRANRNETKIQSRSNVE